MAHTRIFLNIICLMICTWAAVYCLQMKKAYRYDFLSPLVNIIIFFNLIVFNDLMAWYWMTNLYPDPDLYAGSFYGRFMTPLAFSLSVGFYYFFIKILSFFQLKRIRQKLLKNLFCIILIAGLALIMYSILTTENLWHKGFHLTVQGLSLLLVATLYSAMVITLFSLRKDENRFRRRITGSFTVLYLSVLLSMIIIRFFEFDLKSYIVVLLILIFNLFPFYWLRKYFLPFHQNEIKSNSYGNVLDSAYSHYGISRREQEITELIFRGLKNREIEEKLFISQHTVKNHIYNIFKKVGVRNRAQLIRAISEKPDKF